MHSIVKGYTRARAARQFSWKHRKGSNLLFPLIIKVTFGTGDILRGYCNIGYERTAAGNPDDFFSGPGVGPSHDPPLCDPPNRLADGVTPVIGYCFTWPGTGGFSTVGGNIQPGQFNPWPGMPAPTPSGWCFDNDFYAIIVTKADPDDPFGEILWGYWTADRLINGAPPTNAPRLWIPRPMVAGVHAGQMPSTTIDAIDVELWYPPG